LAVKKGKLRAFWDRLHKTKGGVRDTELNELAVRPKKAPSSSRVVMIVTPVANCDRAERNVRGSDKSGVFAESG
jgi:hypothetical protein